MTETLLSPSNVLLFGRIVRDLQVVRPIPDLPSKLRRRDVRVATTGNLANLNGLPNIDTIPLAAGDLVLAKDQNNKALNGVYQAAAGNWTRNTLVNANEFSRNWLFTVAEGATNAGTQWLYLGSPGFDIDEDDIAFSNIKQPDITHSPFVRQRVKSNQQLENQLSHADARLARIYGFSYEGTYYELPYASLFLVHGEGVEATEVRINRLGRPRPARAPGTPSLTGVAAADFQLADDLRVWSYDKADYTIRMDVETGMFEQVLLDMFFGGDGGVSGARVSGARVSGARVSGARVSGARVSGARISGARLSGGRGDAVD